MAWEIQMNTLVELAGSTRIRLFSGIKNNFPKKNLFFSMNFCFCQGKWSIALRIFQNVLSVKMESSKVEWGRPFRGFFYFIFFNFCDCSHTGDPSSTRGISQIWLQVREESRKSLKNHHAIYFGNQMEPIVLIWWFLEFFFPWNLVTLVHFF